MAVSMGSSPEGEPIPDMNTTPLIDVMLECREMIEPQAQKNGIHLSFPQFGCSCFVHADRTRVKQVLINLLSNAVKYTRDRDLALIDTPPELRIQLVREKIGLIHAVAYTHSHADHLFGLDDLRI